MRVGILGPLRVVADGRTTDVGGALLRALLTRLALDAGRPVGHGALSESIWPESATAREPENPASALHSLVSRLRRALPVPGVLRSEPAGYVLDLAADAVDVLRFERLAGEGRDALRDGRPSAAAEHLSLALSLWRGDPLADTAHLPFAVGAAIRLDRLRLGAVEDRVEAELALSGTAPGARVDELERLVVDHPLRERPHALLVAALDADGRRAEALDAYESYRARLAEELGTDPGPRLRELHLRVLRGGRPAGPAATRGNLRSALTSFVGRGDDRRLVARRLAEHRLVTLVGPGGVGKSRLASVAADDALPDAGAPAVPGAGHGAGARAERVWLVGLTAVADPDDVPHATARTLGLRVSSDPVALLAAELAATDTLLVLDGCEHVVDGAARLAEELLGRCPRLRVLATSREPLGVTGEALCPVSPLPPGDAVRLFTDRAGEASPDFTPTEGVDRICRRLDGLPLAIELAAARLRSMPLPVLAARLDDRFRLLTGGSRTALPHHRTLRGVVAWSWDLLTGAERRAAERLSVFASALTAEAAEAVGVEEEILYSLVDRSLLVADGDRYRMLDTIREFGLERLDGADGVHGARSAHAAHFLDLAGRAEPRLRGHGQVEWLSRLSDDRDNLVAALGFARDSGDADTAVRLGSVMGMFWAVRGDHATAARQLRPVLLAAPVAAAGAGDAPRTGARGTGTGRDVPGRAKEPLPAGDEDPLQRAVAAYLLNALLAGELSGARDAPAPAGTGTAVEAFVAAILDLADGSPASGLSSLEPHLKHPDPWTRAMLWLVRSFLDAASGNSPAGVRDLTRAVAGFREAGERWGLSFALMCLATARTASGETDAAVALLEEARSLTRELGTHDGQQVWLAMVRVDAGDAEGARAELLGVVAESASTRLVARARVCLADLARADGDLAEARRLLGLTARLEQDEEIPDRALYGTAAGFLAVASGRPDAAARHLTGVFGLVEAVPDMPMLAHVCVGLADLLRLRGAPERAAEVLGAARVLRGGPGGSHPDVARVTRDLRTHRAAVERGGALSPTGALALAKGVADALAGGEGADRDPVQAARSTPPVPAPVSRGTALTPARRPSAASPGTPHDRPCSRTRGGSPPTPG